MKKPLIVLMVVAIASFLFVGCVLTDWITPEPVVPAPVMEAVVTAALNVDRDAIDWAITNVGDINIFRYVITFRVYYPMKDYVEIAVEGFALKVGAFDTGTLVLEPYGTAEVAQSVDVRWRLQ